MPDKPLCSLQNLVHLSEVERKHLHLSSFSAGIITVITCNNWSYRQLFHLVKMATSRSPWWSLMESPAGCDLPTKLQDGTERWWKHVESFVKDNLSLHQRSLQIVSCHLNLIFSKETGMATTKTLAPGPGHYQLGNVEKRLSFRGTMRSIKASKVRRSVTTAIPYRVFHTWTEKPPRARRAPGTLPLDFLQWKQLQKYQWFQAYVDIYVDIRYLYIDIYRYRYFDIFWILLVHSASAIPHNPPNTINTCVGEAELLWSRRLVLEQMLRVNLCEAMRGIFFAKNGFPRWSWGQLGRRPKDVARLWLFWFRMVPPGSKFDAMREAAVHAAHVTALVSALYVVHLLAMRGLVLVPPVIQVHMLCFRADQPETFASIRQQWLFHAQWLCLSVGMNHYEQYVPPSARCVTWTMGCVICWLQWKNMTESDQWCLDFLTWLEWFQANTLGDASWSPLAAGCISGRCSRAEQGRRQHDEHFILQAQRKERWEIMKQRILFL